MLTVKPSAAVLPNQTRAGMDRNRMVVCPACRGSGESRATNSTCSCCRGSGTVPPHAAAAFRRDQL